MNSLSFEIYTRPALGVQKEHYEYSLSYMECSMESDMRIYSEPKTMEWNYTRSVSIDYYVDISSEINVGSRAVDILEVSSENDGFAYATSEISTKMFLQNS